MCVYIYIYMVCFMYLFIYTYIHMLIVVYLATWEHTSQNCVDGNICQSCRRKKDWVPVGPSARLAGADLALADP